MDFKGAYDGLINIVPWAERIKDVDDEAEIRALMADIVDDPNVLEWRLTGRLPSGKYKDDDFMRKLSIYVTPGCTLTRRHQHQYHSYDSSPVLDELSTLSDVFDSTKDYIGYLDPEHGIILVDTSTLTFQPLIDGRNLLDLAYEKKNNSKPLPQDSTRPGKEFGVVKGELRFNHNIRTRFTDDHCVKETQLSRLEKLSLIALMMRLKIQEKEWARTKRQVEEEKNRYWQKRILLAAFVLLATVLVLLHISNGHIF